MLLVDNFDCHMETFDNTKLMHGCDKILCLYKYVSFKLLELYYFNSCGGIS